MVDERTGEKYARAVGHKGTGKDQDMEWYHLEVGRGTDSSCSARCSAVGESQSNSLVEEARKTVRESVRLLKQQIEGKTNVVLTKAGFKRQVEPQHVLSRQGCQKGYGSWTRLHIIGKQEILEMVWTHVGEHARDQHGSSRRRSSRSTGDKGFEQNHQDGPTKKINAYGTLIVKAVTLQEAKSMQQPGRELVLGEGQPPRFAPPGRPVRGRMTSVDCGGWDATSSDAPEATGASSSIRLRRASRNTEAELVILVMLVVRWSTSSSWHLNGDRLWREIYLPTRVKRRGLRREGREDETCRVWDPSYSRENLSSENSNTLRCKGRQSIQQTWRRSMTFEPWTRYQHHSCNPSKGDRLRTHYTYRPPASETSFDGGGAQRYPQSDGVS